MFVAGKSIRAIVLSGIAVTALFAMATLAEAGKHSKKTSKHDGLSWTPPNVSAPLRSLADVPPCDLPKVLAEVGRHAMEMTANLENFTAREKIEYGRWNQNGGLEENDSGIFDYIFAFEQRAGGRVSREYRTAEKGSHSFPASGRDMGQVALGLIFLPKMQADYAMSCEGLDRWKGQFAWVIYFQQRKDRPRRTLEFHTETGSYGAMLKGRAWISMDTSQVLHIETNLMQDIPSLNLRSSAVVVDYAPVEIQSRKLELWLPQRVESYWEISAHRTVLYHTFSDFQLFTVDTQENVQKPNAEKPVTP